MVIHVIYALCCFCFLLQDFEKLRLTEENLRTKTTEDAKTMTELADQLSKAKLEIDGLKALCNILTDFFFKDNKYLLTLFYTGSRRYVVTRGGHIVPGSTLSPFNPAYMPPSHQNLAAYRNCGL